MALVGLLSLTACPGGFTPDKLTFNTDVCYPDFSGNASSNTRPVVLVNITSGTPWTLENSAPEHFQTNIRGGGAGNFVIEIQLTQLFVEKIEANSLTLTDNIVGRITVTNETSIRDLLVRYQGNGSRNNPRLIFIAADLQDMNKHLDWYYGLAKDITVNNWLPIGDNVVPANNFTGVLDGQGHRIHIESFSPNVPLGGGYCYGVIGYASSRALVQNLHVHVSAPANTVKGDAPVRYGGIAGHINESTRIENCKVSGALIYEGQSFVYLGGIAGYMVASTGGISNCVSEAAINVRSTNEIRLGGLVGACHEGILSHSYATGVVSGVVSGTGACLVGGLAGNAVHSSILSCVALSASVKGIIANGTCGVGRIAGWELSPTLDKNYANVSMTLTGGVVTPGLTTKDGTSVALSATRNQGWWQTTGPGFTFSSIAWKWGSSTMLPKLYWEN